MTSKTSVFLDRDLIRGSLYGLIGISVIFVARELLVQYSVTLGPLVRH
jgi:hypothetical protein